MKSERLAIYGADFPGGFSRVSDARRVSREKLSGLPQSYFPRAPKDGEHLIRVRVDPNGVPYERGDILLGIAIESAAFPNLRGDWEVVLAKPRYTTRHDGGVSGWYRYLLVRAAKPADAARVRAISEEHKARVMDRAMLS